MNIYENIVPVNKNGTINCVIEISQGSKNKYEVDENGLLWLDRFTNMQYPCNYGFIPNTIGGDGDALDVLVISSNPIEAGTLIKLRIIGMLTMEDEGGMDEKILCVPTEKTDRYYAHIHSYEDLPEIVIKNIEHFFKHYKDLDKDKWVKLGEWKCVQDAVGLIAQSIIVSV